MIYEGEKVIAKKYCLYEMDGHSGAFCKCGNTLYIETPEEKSWHMIKCPDCGFVVNLFCGKHGDPIDFVR